MSCVALLAFSLSASVPRFTTRPNQPFNGTSQRAQLDRPATAHVPRSQTPTIQELRACSAASRAASAFSAVPRCLVPSARFSSQEPSSKTRILDASGYVLMDFNSHLRSVVGLRRAEHPQQHASNSFPLAASVRPQVVPFQPPSRQSRLERGSIKACVVAGSRFTPFRAGQ